MLPLNTFKNRVKIIELHLSLNGGLSLEENPSDIPVVFTLLRKPYLEGVPTVTGGYSTTASPYVTTGRGEEKTVTIQGTNMNSLVGKTPLCLFANELTTDVTVINDN